MADNTISSINSSQCPTQNQVSLFKYILIQNNKKNSYRKKIANFYNKYFPEESNIDVTNNTHFFVVALKEKEIIGVVRVLTDYSRYALLLDLIVKKSERNQGVGKQLVKLVTKYHQDNKIRHLILTTDSRFKWLSSFYKKLGFRKIRNQALMEYN